MDYEVREVRNGDAGQWGDTGGDEVVRVKNPTTLRVGGINSRIVMNPVRMCELEDALNDGAYSLVDYGNSETDASGADVARMDAGAVVDWEVPYAVLVEALYAPTVKDRYTVIRRLLGSSDYSPDFRKKIPDSFKDREEAMRLARIVARVVDGLRKNSDDDFGKSVVEQVVSDIKGRLRDYFPAVFESLKIVEDYKKREEAAV